MQVQGGLIEEQDLRVGHQGGGEGQLLLHPLGELLNQVLLPPEKVEMGQQEVNSLL